jgi:steroid delta-isomerase-like uncharacterized protein
MEKRQAQQMADSFIKAWGGGDADLMRSLYDNDVVLYQAPVKERLQGIEHLIKRWEVFQGVGEAELSLRELLFDPEADTAILQITLKGKHTGTFLGYEPTQQEFDVDTCLVLKFNDEGKITQHTTYFDTASLLRAVGLITIEGLPEAA